MQYIALTLLVINAFYHIGALVHRITVGKRHTHGPMEGILWGLMVAIALQFILLHFFKFPNPLVYYFWHGVISLVNLLCLMYAIKNRKTLLKAAKKAITENYIELFYSFIFIAATALIFFFHVGALAFQGAGYMGWMGDYFDYGKRFPDVISGIFLPTHHVGFEVYSTIFQSYFDNYVGEFKLTFLVSTIAMGVMLLQTIKQYLKELGFNHRWSQILSFLAYFWGPIVAIMYPKFFSTWIGFFFPGFQASYWNPTFTLSSMYLIFFVIYLIRKDWIKSSLFLAFSFFLKPSGFFGFAPFIFPFLLFGGLFRRESKKLIGAAIMLIPPLYYVGAIKLTQRISIFEPNPTTSEIGTSLAPFKVWFDRMDNTLLTIMPLEKAIPLVLTLSFAGPALVLLLRAKNKKANHSFDGIYWLFLLTFIWGMAAFLLLRQNSAPTAPNYKWVQAHVSSLMIPFLFMEIRDFYKGMKKNESLGRIFLLFMTLAVVSLHILSGIFQIVLVSGGGLNT